MIKYRPMRQSLSASVKEEQVFETIDKMILSILNTTGRMALYVGQKPYIPDDIVISDPDGDDPMVGWKNVRSISIKKKCIGFCGE